MRGRRRSSRDALALPLALALGFALAFPPGCERQDRPGRAAEGAAGRARPVTSVSGIGQVLLSGGRFLMGSARGEPDEAPVREVEVSAFVMDRTEVTQAELAALEIADPSHFKGKGRPVEQVRWSDAALIANERSRREGLAPAYDEVTFACDFSASGYRLPTEAEWEYAARAGTRSEYEFGSSPRRLATFAWYAETSSGATSAVGRKRANRWGFVDLYGNVAEWCHDVYSAEAYRESPAVDPRGPREGKRRVLRGGSWRSSAAACRSSARAAAAPGITDACFARDTYGFRLVRRPSGSELRLLGRKPPAAAAAGKPAAAGEPAAAGARQPAGELEPAGDGDRERAAPSSGSP